MKRSVLLLALAMVLASCTQNPAPIDYRGSQYYGRDGRYSQGGYEMPKYSNDNRAELPPEQEEKYHSDVQQYGVAAEIGGVATSDLPPPTTLTPPPAPANVTPNYSHQPASSAPQPPPFQSQQTVESELPVTSDPNVVDYYALESGEATPSTAVQNVNVTPQFIWPVRGNVLTAFGGKHQGMSIQGQKGDPIRASDDGRVTSASTQGDLGTVVTVEHLGGWTSQYGHIGEAVVKTGDQVVRGQLVGFVGVSGNVTVPQVYFAVKKNGAAMDPKPLLGNE